MIINSKDLLINQSRIPDRKSEEYKPFWENEVQKLLNGISINGVYISGFLYWHLNIYKTLLDFDEGNGRLVRRIGTPYLRDNEWLIGNKINEASTWRNKDGEVRKKGVVALGTRRFSKTVIQSSWTRYNATLYKGTQNPIVGGSKDQIKLITDEIDRFDAEMISSAYNNIRHFFALDRIETDWKSQVTYGKKDQQGNKFPYSYIPTRNVDGGINTEAAAGLSPQSIIFDEIGTYPFLKALKAALPGLDTPFGWRCSPFCMGTGGDMSNFQDAQDLFDNPDAHNFLSTFVEDENRTCGIYLPGWMSYDVPKNKESLATYLGMPEEGNKDLSSIDILVGNKQLGEEMIDKKRVDASKSNDPTMLLKVTMYYPKNTREIFLSDSNNNFPIPACKAHQFWLKENESYECVDLYRDEANQVKWKNSNLRPITLFPVKPEHEKNAPIVIYEHPIDHVPHGTYAIGVDCYNKNESSDKVNSLGTVYVLKRYCDPLGVNQYSIVASYAGRPDDIAKFYNIVYNLAEYYKGIILPELNERFADFLVNKKKGYLIQNAMQLARDINPTSFAKGSEKGLSPTTRNQRYGMELCVAYTLEEIDRGGHPALGVTRIPDQMLLEEMVQYRAKASTSGGIHDGNFDRIVAFYHALILAEHLDKYMPMYNQKPQSEETQKKPEMRIKGFFGDLTPNKSPFQTDKPKKRAGFGFV